MSYNLNFVIPPPPSPGGSPIISPPTGIRPPGGLGGGILGGLLGWLINELLFPPGTSPAGLDQIDSSLYAPTAPVQVEPPVEAGWFGGQNPTVAYRRQVATAIILNGTFSYWQVGYGGMPAGFVYPVTSVRMTVAGQTYSGLQHWSWEGQGMSPVFPDRNRSYQIFATDATGVEKFVASYSNSGTWFQGFVKQDNTPDGTNPPPLSPGTLSPGGTNPPPQARSEPPMTHEEFRSKYGAPPKLKPPIPPLRPDTEEEKKAPPLEFPEFFPDTPVFPAPKSPPVGDPGKDTVKPGVAPDTSIRTTTKPGGSSNTTQKFVAPSQEDKITVINPYISPIPNSPSTPNPIPEPDLEFEEEIKKKLNKIVEQTTETRQKTNIETAICTSVNTGCLKPLKQGIDDLLGDDDEISCDPELIEIELPTWTCDHEQDPPFIEESISVQVPDYLASTIASLVGQQKAIAKSLCELDTSIPLPQDWHAKRTNVPPQAVVVFRRLSEGSRGYSKICIPWLSSAEPTSEALIPNYTKGQFYGAIHYIDNSKFIIYCSTEQEARTIVNSVVEKIDSSKLDNPPRLSFGERKGYPLVQEGMKAVKQYYFPDGKQVTKPAWMRYVIPEE